MKNFFLSSLLFFFTTVCLASQGWVVVKNQSSEPWEFGYAYEDNTPSLRTVDKEWSDWYDTSTDPEEHRYKERIIRIYDGKDKTKLLVELYSAADHGPTRTPCDFEVVLDKDKRLSARVTYGNALYYCKVTLNPVRVKQNSLSLKVDGTMVWAPIVKLGDEPIKPDLCAANTNPDLVEQTQKLCNLWYGSDKNSVDINGTETRNIKIYDRRNPGKLLIDLQTALTSDTEQCKYTVTFNEKNSSGSKYTVSVADSRCKYTVTP